MPLSSLHFLDERCPLCQILSECLSKDEIKDTKMPLLEAQRYVRICAVPTLQDHSIRSDLIKPGLPVFLQSGSSSHFKLMKEWLRLCDKGKCSESGGCRPKLNDAPMPSRLIDVRGNKISPTVCLILTDEMTQGIHYVALSHCWGKLEDGQKDSWCTTRENEEHRRTKGFLVEPLPQTFKDAVRVTRELGQRYLWIDSLCIIQGKGGNWETEAKNMEAVFRNAYCTIAATSAEDSTKGFLNRPEESNLQYVTVPKSSHGKVYVCRSIDDFPCDVEEGVLNKRAWVLQERALSRRTIHFTKRQTYWECGGGVRCETLTYMRNENLSFRSDPEFPHSITKRSRTTQVELFQSLFADYSNFGLTEVTDRPIAIDSLAMALAKAFHTNVRYGIFERYLHRSLLWQRSQDIPMRRIFYAAGKTPPSWSWMAYHGQIEYSKIQDVEWDRSVQFVTVSNAASSLENDGNILEARVRRLQDCEIKPESRKHVIRDQKDNEVGHLCFDIQPDHVIRVKKDNEVGYLCFDTQPGKALIEVRCAIMGRETRGGNGKRKYYVLFVTECVTQPECGKFERLGMGWIQQRFILFDGQDDVAQIL
ncbi:HET-domain-containing protein [Cadophora sp. DSE1049]|nr:HET-domain-containing protein [Cadophora sp. DSE1049]